MKKSSVFTVLVLTFFLFSPQLSAQIKTNDNAILNTKLSLSASLGYLDGKSVEEVYSVYDSNQLLSHLDWRIQHAAIIKGQINYDYLNWLTASAEGWVTVAKGSAIMDDYDWFTPNQSAPSHWSHHPNTQLRYANDVDLSLQAWLLQDEQYRMGLTGGYKRSTFSFLAKGGCYQYDNGRLVGCFPANELGIGYQQKFDTVYMGLTGQYFINRFEFSGLLKYSPWVNSADVDKHYQRNLTFTEEGCNADFYAAVIKSGFKITPKTQIFLEATYNQYTNTIADTTIIIPEEGQIFMENTAGLNNHHYFIALGIQYKPEI